MSPIPNFKLNTGASIPAIGLGTWQSAPGQVEEAVEFALKNGYRHIDCAWAYQNEAEVGQGIKASGVPRSEIFITSKLPSTFHTRVEECLSDTLEKLGTDYVDLYLIHWPVVLNHENTSHPLIPRKPDGTRDVVTHIDANVDTWKAMEAVYKSGKAKAIGISNWSVKNITKLLETATVVPAANQVELHPYLPQNDLLEFCTSKGIIVEAYSPLGSSNSPLLVDEDILKIAKKHDAEAGQVLISYQVKRGVVVLPKSVTPSRIANNAKVVDLDADDMTALNHLHKIKAKRFIKPDWGVDLGFSDW